MAAKNTGTDEISIHAPLAGCDTEHDLPAALGDIYFNPRTPCGVRHRLGRTAGHQLAISIHAPLAGCDYHPFCVIFPASDFNPRTPCGVRRSILKRMRRHFLFQSTHPLRGATRHRRGWPHRSGHFNPRTPCGVRLHNARCVYVSQTFQSTHPLRGATRIAVPGHDAGLISIHAPLAGCDGSDVELFDVAGAISIHAPLAGCDSVYAKSYTVSKISIHAPLAGCDSRVCPGDARRPHFNPRTPCGVRRCGPFSGRDSCEFQSTHPLRGATNACRR